MKRYSWIILLGAAFFLTSCSKNEEEVKKGAIEEMTDKAAEKAVKKIRTPIEQAEAVSKVEEERVEKLDETIEDDK